MDKIDRRKLFGLFAGGSVFAALGSGIALAGTPVETIVDSEEVNKVLKAVVHKVVRQNANDVMTFYMFEFVDEKTRQMIKYHMERRLNKLHDDSILLDGKAYVAFINNNQLRIVVEGRLTSGDTYAATFESVYMRQSVKLEDVT